MESIAQHPMAALVVRVGSRICALRISDVRETMRPLPIEPVFGTPAFVRGVSIIRGVPVPVVDLAVLLGADDRGAWTRFVTLRVDGRAVAVAVDEVVGVRELDPTRLERVAPLFGDSRLEVVEAMGALDRELLVVLRAAKTISEDVWRTLDSRRNAS